ncbi:iron chelate uptake ABC transporter family permease subunit [Methylobacterium sp. C25]|uniref:iron chelate uptake ABC transporter family permease subunit n=1 Tax=Methylobacterium sp. C25 TaxID=2721622 RepID=UPI001F47FE99|nr:iron chelate uptake ABC transporter family permease subunit [Methylobacterium sp. C25]MCE4226540.1 iron chelate uptake ABC transporter family permease subunit [Methylobacterium sp. C25]
MILAWIDCTSVQVPHLAGLARVGAMAAYLAHFVGFARAQKRLPGSILIGCGLMAAADLLSRLLFYPYQMPVDHFASLVGAPYLVWAVMRPSSS